MENCYCVKCEREQRVRLLDQVLEGVRDVTLIVTSYLDYDDTTLEHIVGRLRGEDVLREMAWAGTSWEELPKKRMDIRACWNIRITYTPDRQEELLKYAGRPLEFKREKVLCELIMRNEEFRAVGKVYLQKRKQEKEWQYQALHHYQFGDGF